MSPKQTPTDYTGMFFHHTSVFYSYVFADRKLAFCLVSLIKNLLACVSRF